MIFEQSPLDWPRLRVSFHKQNWTEHKWLEPNPEVCRHWPRTAVPRPKAADVGPIAFAHWGRLKAFIHQFARLARIHYNGYVRWSVILILRANGVRCKITYEHKVFVPYSPVHRPAQSDTYLLSCRVSSLPRLHCHIVILQCRPAVWDTRAIQFRELLVYCISKQPLCLTYLIRPASIAAEVSYSVAVGSYWCGAPLMS